MSGVVRQAPAKLNLVLEVDPPRPDGYHPIRSLMAVLPDVADTVRVMPAPSRAVECPGVPERDNLAWRALDALAAEVGAPMDLRVEIEKGIPSQAGLGGGSSDAAATLVAANELCGLGLSEADLERVASTVGSDVPFFVRGGVQWAEGRGEILRAVDPPAPSWVVLVRPPIGLSTPAVYRRLDTMVTSRADATSGEGASSPLGRNDLWPPALALAPGLGRVARALRVAGADRVMLCGSGSTIAGICTSDAQRLALLDGLAADPAWWVASSRVG